MTPNACTKHATNLVLLHPSSVLELIRVNLSQQFSVHHAELSGYLATVVEVELLWAVGGATVDGRARDATTWTVSVVFKVQWYLYDKGAR